MMNLDASSASIPSLLVRLSQQISRKRRRQFIFLLVLTVAGSFAEVVSLASVLPFIGVLMNPQKVLHYAGVRTFMKFVGVSTAAELVLPLTIAFISAAVIAGSLRVLLLWVSLHLSQATGAELSNEGYRRTLYQPYWIHVERNSSELISGITEKMGAASSVLVSIVAVATSATLFCSILITLIVINPMVSLVAILGFGCCYGMIVWKVKARLARNSMTIARGQTKVMKALQEGLGGIREVLIDGAQHVFCSIYWKAISRLRHAAADNTFINQAPRFAVEAIGMIMIAALAYWMSASQGGMASAMPILAALALGAQKMLPLMQIFYGNWSVVSGSRVSLIEALEILEQPISDDALSPRTHPLPFQGRIVLDNVSFRYRNGPWVLEGINLDIPKGSRIGFIGGTGSGKSTLLDLIMGLLEPTQGSISVDGVALEGRLKHDWQINIAHVPQSIFLTDSTIAENIAFGVPSEEIDMDRVRDAADKAQIADFIERTHEGYEAMVGERGIRISGGQRQRIGIARALYKRAKVLVFDEATSALDVATEQAVMGAIENLDRDLTVLIIAHRLGTLRNCDSIVKLEHGRVVAQGPAKQFIDAEEAYLQGKTQRTGDADISA